jgi:toxin CcdB
LACSEKIFGGGNLRQYEVFDNPSSRSRSIAPYVVVLQSHLGEGLPSAIAAPLLVASRAERFPYLSNPVRFRDSDLVLSMYELANFDQRQLRDALGDLTEYHEDIVLGLQRIFIGVRPIVERWIPKR